MHNRRLVLAAASVLILTALLLAVGSSAQASIPSASGSDNISYAFAWNEGSNFVMVMWWNAPSRAACDYASNPWPQAELAAQRSYILAARQVLRNEWDINSWIANNRDSNSQARIHGAETNCPIENGLPHLDWPPHVHVFYRALSPNGDWLQINSHHYPNAQGQIYDDFVIPGLCNQGASYHVPAGTWLDMLDETCGVAWQQRYTGSGDLQLRRSSSADVYTLRNTSISGDLSSSDVLLNGQVIYTIDIVEYDPIAFRMVARITDYRKNQLVTETWLGDPAAKIMLTSHTVQVSSLSSATDTPTVAPANTPTTEPTATPTLAPTDTPTTAPTSTPTAAPTAAAPTATPTSLPPATPTALPTATPSPTPQVAPQVGGPFRLYLPIVR